MAIDPKLVTIKNPSEYTTKVPTEDGYFFYFEDGVLYKASMTDIYNKVNGAFGGDLLIVDNPAPTTPTWYFAKESGTYANADGLVVDTDGKFVILNYDGSAWSMIETAALEGKSAYEVALDNGFVGTEAEWLASLGVSDITQLTGVEYDEGVVADFASTTWNSGAFISGGSGGIITYPGWSYSEMIPITGGESYSFISSGEAIIWYENDVFIGSGGAQSDNTALRTFIAPSNATSARINQSDANLPNFKMTSGQPSITIPELIINPNQIDGGFTDDLSHTKPVVNLVANALDFATYPITGNVIVSGDSTIAAYAGGIALSAIITATGTITNIAVPGHTIDQQIAAWNALSAGVKTAANFVFVQIGLNDVSATLSPTVAIGRLQAFLNLIKSTSTAKIVIGTMLPAKARWITLYGSVNGLIAWENAKTINYFIENGLILNYNAIASVHTYQLDDGLGNLAAEFNTGDGIHENTEGRKIIAYSWLSAYSKIK